MNEEEGGFDSLNRNIDSPIDAYTLGFFDAVAYMWSRLTLVKSQSDAIDAMELELKRLHVSTTRRRIKRINDVIESGLLE